MKNGSPKLCFCERKSVYLTLKLTKITQVRDRSFITSRGWWGTGGLEGGGYNFLRGLILGFNIENAQNVRVVEILRHRTGLLCKSFQTTAVYHGWSKSTFPIKEDKKIRFGGSLSATKCYPYKAWPSNLSAISPTRNVVCMSAHTPMHRAEIWKK